MTSREYEHTWKLLHPELLSYNELLCILRERNVEIEEKFSGSKEHLVEIFKRIAMPQSQRMCYQYKKSKNNVEITNNLNNERNSSNGTQVQTHSVTHGLAGHKTTSAHCDVSNQANKNKLKRVSSQMSNNTREDGPSPKKREKITWP